MKNIYIQISLHIIFMFTTAMLFSLLPEYYPELFGDWKCEGAFKKGDEYFGCDMSSLHNPTIHWGYRHYLYMLMGVSLFIVQLAAMIVKIDKKLNQ